MNLRKILTRPDQFWAALRGTGAALALGLALCVAAPDALAQEPVATPETVVSETVEAVTEAVETVEEAVVEAVAEEEAAAPDLLASQQALALETGNTSWILTSTALVLMMTIPGLALFYGGLTRQRNIINTVAMIFAITCVISVLWQVVIYSIAFGTNGNAEMNKWFGGFDLLMLNHVTDETSHSATADLPEWLWVVYQMTFAIITVALVVGSYVERMKFMPMLVFSALWGVLVYGPICHWVWGGGWLGDLGAMDFAGGTVVHINAGVAGLMCALVLGKRKGLGSENMAPNNLVYTMIGAALLWVGWFGFNAGSEWAADAVAARAMLNTQVATAIAAITWMIIEWAHRGKPGMLGLASGAIAGLVAITPAAGLVNPDAALIIGAAGAAGAYFGAVILKNLLKYDDSLDVFGIHGVAGIIGAILTGVFGLGVEDVMGQVMIQLTAVGATIGYVAVMTLIILIVVRLVFGLRAKPEAETEGLDQALHGETLHSN
jgi:Amt family ammonium transporter